MSRGLVTLGFMGSTVGVSLPRLHESSFVVAISGGIGSGKSTVSRMLADSFDVDVLDADGIARNIMTPGKPALQEVVDRFGADLVDEHGQLIRQKLADIVFHDKTELAALNAITAPHLLQETRHAAEKLSAPCVVHDLPLLGPDQQSFTYDLIVMVTAPTELKLTRLADRGVHRVDAEARMANQITDAERLTIADAEVVNDRDLQHLKHQVENLWQQHILPHLAT